MNDDHWIRVCATDDVAPGEAIRIERDPPVAVYNVDGEYYATDDTCTHEDYSLADGYIEGDQVECALHAAKFCIRTGEVLCFPATQSLRTYPVKITDADVYLAVRSTTPG